MGATARSPEAEDYSGQRDLPRSGRHAHSRENFYFKAAFNLTGMEIKIIKTDLASTRDFRVLFLHENHFQFVHDKCQLYD